MRDDELRRVPPGGLDRVRPDDARRERRVPGPPADRRPCLRRCATTTPSSRTAGSYSFRAHRARRRPGPDGRGQHGDRASDAPPARRAAADDGRAARRRRAPRRTARRAHRVGGVDLRALRLRHRDVHHRLGARVRVRAPARPADRRRAGAPRRRRRGEPTGARRCTAGSSAGARRRAQRPAEWWPPLFAPGRADRGSSPRCTTAATGTPTRSRATRSTPSGPTASRLDVCG